MSSQMIFDPDCVICNSPANVPCECEGQQLDQAVRNAEQRMMSGMLEDIRNWVRAKARDYIIEYYKHLKLRRTDTHQRALMQITQHAHYYFHMQPNPSVLLAADIEYKRGLNEDWRASVLRYPEMLEYFYSLVDLSLPSDDDTSVLDPPLSALHGVARRARMADSGALAVGEKGARRTRSRTRTAPRLLGTNGLHNMAAYDMHGGNIHAGYTF